MEKKKLEEIANYLRYQVLKVCEDAKNGHIGGSLSAIELFTSLYFGGHLQFNSFNPSDPNRDLVIVRGHLGPLRYSIFNLLGWVSDDELGLYRKYGSRLAGHEDHLLTPGVDVSPTGSLGMVLSYAAGIAISDKNQKIRRRIFTFIGDGEEQEGNISEAARHISHLGLANIIVVIDKNGKQLGDSTEKTDSGSNLSMIWKGYGWNVINVIDGHSISDISKAYEDAMGATTPTVIIAETIKGNGLPSNKTHYSGYHTYSTVEDGIVRSLVQERPKRPALILNNNISVDGGTSAIRKASTQHNVSVVLKEGTPNNPDSCQFDYFSQLKDVWSKERTLYFISADTTQANIVEKMGLLTYVNYFNVGIREQHTVALAHGISITDPNAVIVFNTLDAFVYRWMDQLQALIQGGGRMVVISDCAGLTNSKNGKTHQTTSQPMAVRSMPGVTFLEPWDAKDTFSCLNWSLNNLENGVIFIRSHRYDVDLIDIGRIDVPNNYVVFEAVKPEVVIVASGVTVGESIRSANILQDLGVRARVINVVNHTAISSVIPYLEANVPILTVYNGSPDMLGVYIAKELIQNKITTPMFNSIGYLVGQTGSTEDLLEHYGLDAKGITKTVLSMLS